MYSRTHKDTWIGVGSYLLGVALVLVAGCKQRAGAPDLPTGYSVARENPLWESVVWINGQPARRFEGTSSGLWDITQFVIQGENTIRVEATWNPRPPLGSQLRAPCNLKLVGVILGEQRPSYTELKNLTAEGDDAGDTIKSQHIFSATVPLRWIWQDADELGELSPADKSQVLALYEKLAASYRAKDLVAASALLDCWWIGERPTIAGNTTSHRGRAESSENHARAISQAEIVTLPQQHLTFSTGSRIVMLFCPGTEEGFGGPQPRALIAARQVEEVGTNHPGKTMREVMVNPIADVLYFVRVAGTWRVLTGAWEY
jgi:hypothetical protein